MENYERAAIELVSFDADDVIATSEELDNDKIEELDQVNVTTP